MPTKSAYLLFILIAISATTSIAQQRLSKIDSTAFVAFLAKKNVWGDSIVLGKSKKQKEIKAYYYNKKATDKAMIIAGVHGSEYYGVDVVNALKESLNEMQVDSFKWSILIIPEVFPDNVKTGVDSTIKGNTYRINIGRESLGWFNPNRQMPKLNQPYKIGDDKTNELLGLIEYENQILLFVTQTYNSTRIASVHCKNENRWFEIGIFADPRTYKDPANHTANLAFGFTNDSTLAIDMALKVHEKGGSVYGNFIINKTYSEGSRRIPSLLTPNYFNAIYPQDSAAVKRGKKQGRTYESRDYKNQISYGTWASSEIKVNNKIIKKAATIITIELPQYYSFYELIYSNGILTKEFKPDSFNTPLLKKNTAAYLSALKDVFLGD